MTSLYFNGDIVTVFIIYNSILKVSRSISRFTDVGSVWKVTKLVVETMHLNLQAKLWFDNHKHLSIPKHHLQMEVNSSFEYELGLLLTVLFSADGTLYQVPHEQRQV